MASPSYARSAFGLAKRIKIAPPKHVQFQHRSVYQSRQPWHADNSVALEHHRQDSVDFDEFMAETAHEARGITLPAREVRLPRPLQKELDALRPPRSVQLNYLRPLKRAPTHGVPACDLQLRSYSVRNLDFFADLALRAAYYLRLPARGPVPLPRITERWTVPRSNFVHKKSQENFERVTMRRLVQVQDAHPEAVQVWLGFLQKYAQYGVGMKANVWEYSGLEVARDMDEQAEGVRGKVMERLALFGRRKDLSAGPEVERLMNDDVFKGAAGSLAPMGSRVL